jgi:GH25 family lysozyme M1 (1,4-beta-N-acetylmuramidase)
MKEARPRPVPQRAPVRKPRRTAARHPGRQFADLYEGDPVFDARAYRETGAPFIVLKATQGTWHVDTKHSLRVRMAHEQFLPVGHYHFLSAGVSAVEQADFFWRTAREHWAPNDFLIIDCERDAFDAYSPSLVRNQLSMFDRYLHQISGRLAIGYSEQSFLHECDLAILSRKWWIADYGANPGRPPRGQELWAHQYTDAGRIAGTSGSVDLSVLVAASAVAWWDK